MNGFPLNELHGKLKTAGMLPHATDFSLLLGETNTECIGCYERNYRNNHARDYTQSARKRYNLADNQFFR